MYMHQKRITHEPSSQPLCYFSMQFFLQSCSVALCLQIQMYAETTETTTNPVPLAINGIFRAVMPRFVLRELGSRSILSAV